MRRYLVAHVPIALAYSLFVAAVKGSWWPFEIETVLIWVWWLLGVFSGVFILFIDRVVYTYSYPEEQLSQQFAWFVKNKQYLRALEILDVRRHEQERLTFRSVLFIAVWVPLAFFALTSTSGLFGKGVVMGLMLHILYDSWRMQKENPAGLDRRLFWQIKRTFTREEKIVFMWAVTVIFVWFSFWVR